MKRQKGKHEDIDENEFGLSILIINMKLKNLI